MIFSIKKIHLLRLVLVFEGNKMCNAYESIHKQSYNFSHFSVLFKCFCKESWVTQDAKVGIFFSEGYFQYNVHLFEGNGEK